MCVGVTLWFGWGGVVSSWSLSLCSTIKMIHGPINISLLIIFAVFLSITFCTSSRRTVVGIVTALQAGPSGLRVPVWVKGICLYIRPDPLWDLPSPSIAVGSAVLSPEQSGGVVKVTSYLHLVPRLRRMSVAIPLPPLCAFVFYV